MSKGFEFVYEQLSDIKPNTNISVLNLSVYNVNDLKRIGVNNVLDLSLLSDELIFNNFSKSNIIEILNAKEEAFKCLEFYEYIFDFDYYRKEILFIKENIIYFKHDIALIDDNIDVLNLSISLKYFLTKHNICFISDLFLCNLEELLVFNFDVLISKLNDYFYDNLLLLKDFPSNNIYTLENKILNVIVKKNIDGILADEILEKFKNIFNVNAIENLLNELILRKKIYLENDRIYYRFEKISDYVNKLDNGVYRILMNYILNGYSVISISKKFEIKVDWIIENIKGFWYRHIENILKHINYFYEDRYAYIYQTYDISITDFIYITCENNVCYNYLKLKYNSGYLDLKCMLNDCKISNEIKSRVKNLYLIK